MRPLILCYDLAVAPFALTVAKAGPCIVVLNPHEGCGRTTDPDFGRWQDLARQLHGITGCLVLGYVNLIKPRHRTIKVRSLPEVAGELTTWATYFQIDGVWLDNAFDGRDDIRALISHVRWNRHLWTLALNPGTKPSAFAWTHADLVCDYEANELMDPKGWPAQPVVHPAQTVRIVKGSAKTAARITEQATAAKIAALCITDRMNYQRPPSWQA